MLPRGSNGKGVKKWKKGKKGKRGKEGTIFQVPWALLSTNWE